MADPRPKGGFTLLELLVTLALGGMVLGLASSVITSHLRSTQKQAELQRMRDHWGRINFFLETEIREGQSLGVENGVGICASKAGRVLTVTVPNPAASGSTGLILYYNKDAISGAVVRQYSATEPWISATRPTASWWRTPPWQYRRASRAPRIP